MNISEIIKKTIKKALEEMGVHDIDISLEHPVNLSYGDYSTNVALTLSKKLKKNPKELAEEIVKILNKEKTEEIEKVEVAGAGFINFFLSKKFFEGEIENILKTGHKYGSDFSLEKKQILVEYTDPNTFKVFHIGHMMSNSIGESIARIIAFSGNSVVKICYPSDIGLHIAKAVWAMMKNEKDVPKEGSTLPEKTDFLGKCYVEGTNLYESDPNAKIEIDKINKEIFEAKEGKTREFYLKGRGWSLEHFEEIYKTLGTKFDDYVFESETGPIGAKIVRDNVKTGIFEESDGAVVFKGEKYGLHTRVFINSENFPTYESKDIGLNIKKFEKYPKADKSIIITGNEQDDYFKVMIKALSLIDENAGSKTKHIGHGMLRFAEGKMSSRTGKVITGESLLSDLRKIVYEKISDRNFDVKEREEVARAVSVGAIKYSILKNGIGSNIVYDFEKSISFEGDSGPYLQYSYARTSSLIEKSKGVDYSSFGLDHNLALVKLIYRFPEIVRRAYEELEPHYIANYLIELSGAFNNFYANNQILGGKDDTTWRLALTQAFNIVLKNGLNILAIPVLEKM
jgi:arginyl-tRNA synthetase